MLWQPVISQVKTIKNHYLICVELSWFPPLAAPLCSGKHAWDINKVIVLIVIIINIIVVVVVIVVIVIVIIILYYYYYCLIILIIIIIIIIVIIINYESALMDTLFLQVFH